MNFKIKIIFISTCLNLLFSYILNAQGVNLGEVLMPKNPTENPGQAFGDIFGVMNEIQDQRIKERLLFEMGRIQDQIYIDLGSYDPCLKVVVSFIYDQIEQQLSPVTVYGAPLNKTIKLQTLNKPTTLTYSIKKGGSSLSQEGRIALNGILKVNPNTNCNIKKEIIYNELITQANERYNKAKDLLAQDISKNLVNPNDYKESIKQESDLNDKQYLETIANLKSKEKECITRKEKLLEEAKILKEKTIQALNEVNTIKNKLPKEQHEVDNLENKKEALKRKYDGPCPPGWYKCNCPEIHGTDCHADGYDCKDWPRQIPENADYRKVIKKEIQEVYNNAKSKTGDLTNDRERIKNANNNAVFYQQQTANKTDEANRIDCNPIKRQIDNQIDERNNTQICYNNAKNELTDVEKFWNELSSYLDQLHMIELAIYTNCADGNEKFVRSKDLVDLDNQYSEMLKGLKSIDYVGMAIIHANYPNSPLFLWESAENKGRQNYSKPTNHK